ncbi:cardioacceleratory peptide receptor-like [Anneissia japonica]|uniref:cardioacceleratory peptide receptor-like n=1 Tax=Anneissia japonica TaxID=1529436 RepID=UPI001425AE57|nr:cardioacceleratory peptide receptor-like [Anneissia japonica]
MDDVDNTTDFLTTDIPTITEGESRIVKHQDIQLIVLWTLFVSILIGNGAVLLALYTVRHKKSRMNFFVMNLALSDILVGIFEVLVQLIHRGYTRTWRTGNIACKIIKYFQAGSVATSSFQLVALSVDRYQAIIYPMNFSGRKGNYDNLKTDESRSHRASSRGLIPKAKIKTIYITLSIVIAFVVCWSPFCFYYLLTGFDVIGHHAKAAAVIANLPAINSAVNPLIYGIFSTNLCRELK